MVQHFRGQLSGLSIEQNEELQRSSTCVQDCQQFIDIVNLEKEKGMVSLQLCDDDAKATVHVRRL